MRIPTIFSILAIAFFAIPGISQANPLELPAVFAITGVASDDTLNVRSSPSSKSSDIGDLAHDGKIEVTAYDESGKWARIVWGESDGWIARRFLREINQYSDGQSGMPAKLRCSGTEPFWSLQILPDRQLTFTKMGGPDDYQIISDISQSHNDTRNYAFTTLGANLSGFLSRAQCSDGMSDATYGWSLNLMDRRQHFTAYTGCCWAIIRD